MNEQKTLEINSSRDETAEISFFHLLLKLIENKWIFIGVFILTFSLSILYVFTRKSAKEIEHYKWTYTSYLSISQSSPKHLIEPAESIATLINEVYIHENLDKYPVEIEFIGNILKLQTHSKEENDGDIAKYHKLLLMPFVDRYREASHQEAGSYIQDSEILPTEIIKLAQKRKYIKPQKTNFSATLLSFFISLIMGILGVLTVEFLIKLRREITKI